MLDFIRATTRGSFSEFVEDIISTYLERFYEYIKDAQALHASVFPCELTYSYDKSTMTAEGRKYSSSDGTGTIGCKSKNEEGFTIVAPVEQAQARKPWCGFLLVQLIVNPRC